MGKTLIIAEKPSVAADIVKALPGKFSKAKTHYESEEYLVSFAIGHLVSIAYPEEIDPRYQKWSLDNLPILPEEFPLAVLPETKTQFNALARMIRSREVDTIVNACDAGREGELIFKYILRQAATRAVEGKKIMRLWLQSMTLDAIRDGLSRLRDDKEMLPLEDTALCRSQSDWLIGINATRALTGHNSRFGGFRKTPCGRVQTPTLSLIVHREHERLAFTPGPTGSCTANSPATASSTRGSGSTRRSKRMKRGRTTARNASGTGSRPRRSSPAAPAKMQRSRRPARSPPRAVPCSTT